MTVVAQQISVGTGSAVLLAEASVDRPMTVYLGPGGVNGCFIGGDASVTISTGYPGGELPQDTTNGSLPITLQPGDALYAIAPSVTVTVFVLTLNGA